MSAASTDTANRGVPLALGALALALAGPAVALLAAEVSRRSGALVMIVAPPAALAMISVFAFHVRFALGAIESEKKSATMIAAFAILVGVIGFFGGLATVLGIPAADGGLVPLR